MKLHLSLALLALLLAASAPAQEAYGGYNLVSPMTSTETKLVDVDGTVIQTWTGAQRPKSMAYLIEDGVILRPTKDTGEQFGVATAGGRLQIIDETDAVIWDYVFSTADYVQHHDIQPMPDGNVLVIAWERKTIAEAEAVGRETLGSEFWPTLIAEIEPVGATGGSIVWEWHAWDHLIQDVDPAKPNFGVISEHPELIDINLHPGTGSDWLHSNAIDYDEARDEIIISFRPLGEFFVIDHSTTTAEAAGHTGGNHGKGGDILYRWGNPANYGRGDSGDRTIGIPHGANWIDEGLPGAGNVLVFDNGPDLTADYAAVYEIMPPRDEFGHFVLEAGEPYGPAAALWSYGEPGGFVSGPTQGGVFRLPNGNTQICAVINGYLFEVTSAGEVVWEYSEGANIARAMRYWDEGVDAPEAAPVSGRLQGVSPNPFNPSTKIWFSMEREGRVTLAVHGVDGRRVATLADRVFGAGEHSLSWNGRDDSGRALASGLYLLKMSTAGYGATEKMLLLK